MPKPIDYDALLKDFITDFFPDFVAFVNPELYEAVDWSKGYEFLEQELINALRGKFKVRGKRKYTDKLVKMYLKKGVDHYVFVHGEFQHQLEVGFARRMYEYRALIGLRYGIENITACAVFTGAAPPKTERGYHYITFGTKIEYSFISIVAVELDEQTLIAQSDNPFAIAMLAAKYAYISRNDTTLRLELKTKLFTLIRSKHQTLVDKIVKLLIFVRDFVHLPRKLENEFRRTQFSLAFPNEEKMIISEGTKEFALGLYEHVFGYNPMEVLAEEKKKLTAERRKMSKERKKIAEELLKMEEERQRAEGERLRLDNTICYLYEKINMPIAEIATITNKDTSYIEQLLQNNLKTDHNQA